MISTNRPFFFSSFWVALQGLLLFIMYYCMRAAHFRCDLSLLISPRSLALLFLVFFGSFCGLNLSPCVVLCCVVLFFFGGALGWVGLGLSFLLPFFAG